MLLISVPLCVCFKVNGLGAGEVLWPLFRLVIRSTRSKWFPAKESLKLTLIIVFCQNLKNRTLEYKIV